MTDSEPPRPETTRFVLLGSERFPDYPDLPDSPTFRRSSEELGKYLLDPSGFGLPAKNLLNLFDRPDPHSDLDKEIAAFFREAAEADSRPRDVIIYYVGHGGFSDDSEFFLALRDTRKDNPYFTGYPIKALARTLKEHARHSRKFLLLDCCFSAAAYQAFQATPPRVALEKAKSEFEGTEVPGKGTALLCAASADDPAKAPAGEEFTMFSGALLELLTGGIRDQPLKLSLAQIRDSAYDLIKERYREEAVRPELHSPEQKHGDIAKIPLFPVPARGRPGGTASGDEEGFRNALDPTTFDRSSGAAHCVIVTAESRGDRGFPLEEHVRRAWDHYGGEIHKALAKYLATHGLNRRTTLDTSRRPALLQTVLSILPVGDAFQSEQALVRSVEAICKADVAVFDVTGFEAGVMLLLGVRSVARRGVTICSLGGEYIIGGRLDLPFNLQMLNLAAHSEDQEDRGPDPLELIGQKIARGFRELVELPHYLDLPAYDFVRRLGVESSAYRPVQYSERILVLCPFSRQYSKLNWKQYLSKELLGEVKKRLRETENRASSDPKLVRLLDINTPRLVAQTLYEAIRLTDMCVVDWTDLRANVMYELGVRLATNPLGAVHIIEKTEAGRNLPENGPAHGKTMMKLFAMIPYECQPGRIKAYKNMIDRFEMSLDPEKRNVNRLIYETVGKTFDRGADPVSLPVVEELVRSANLLASDDYESTGISSTLYHDVSEEVLREARGAAAERRLAAWLFIDRYYLDSRIQGDADLNAQYRKLGAQVRRWLKTNPDADLESYIKTRLRKLKRRTRQDD